MGRDCEGPWVEAKERYVQGDESLATVAKELQLSYRTVHNRSSSEGWVAQRKAYREEVSAKARKQSVDKAVEDLVSKNTSLGEQWYKAAEFGLKQFLDPEATHNSRRAHALAAAIATDKWRLLTGQETGDTKAQSVDGDDEEMTEEEAIRFLKETVSVIDASEQHKRAAETASQDRSLPDAEEGEG